MKTFITLFKTELKLTIRHLDLIVFGIAFPIGVMLLLGTVFGDKVQSGTEFTMVQLCFGGTVAVGICATGLMGIPLTFADYRHKKILKRFKVTPISPLRLLGAQFLVQFLMALVSALGVWAVARGAFGMQFKGSVWSFIGVYLGVLLCTYSIGMIIASLAPNIKIANLICTFVYFPMLLLSGATVPFEVLPKTVQHIAEVFPVTQGIKLLKGAVVGEALMVNSGACIALVLITLLGIGITAKCFRWE